VAVGVSVGKPRTPEPDEPESADAGGVRSVARALEILSLLTERRPVLTIRDIVAETGLAKTTAIRLVQTLDQCNLVWATENGYMAGPGLWRWAHLARTSWELPPEIREMMRHMTATLQETVNVYVVKDLQRVCIAHEESPRALRHVINVGDDFPLWSGASAKVLLAGSTPEFVERVLAAAPTGELDKQQLRAGVAKAARDGAAISHGERESGVSAVAVPVFNRGGTVIAALSLSGATSRFVDERIPELTAALRKAAAEMTERGFDHAHGRGA
jgi:DNA-binding IclR family transcriptional regulator